MSDQTLHCIHCSPHCFTGRASPAPSYTCSVCSSTFFCQVLSRQCPPSLHRMPCISLLWHKGQLNGLHYCQHLAHVLAQSRSRPLSLIGMKAEGRNSEHVKPEGVELVGYKRFHHVPRGLTGSPAVHCKRIQSSSSYFSAKNQGACQGV